MRRSLVAGNWKMNGSPASVDLLMQSLLGQVEEFGSVDLAVCPSHVFVQRVAELAEGRIAVGGQDVSEYAGGAYTGEVSVSMLAELGCRYVIVGHSERRALFGDSDARVAAKFAAVKAAGMVPILCVGETLEERQAGETLSVVARQLGAVQQRVAGAFEDAVVAYEPVWAIGTGLTASPEQAQEVHASLRAQLAAQGEKTRILYGGSVNAANAGALFAQPDIDGGLVGGASLKAEEFVAICRAAAG